MMLKLHVAAPVLSARVLGDILLLQAALGSQIGVWLLAGCLEAPGRAWVCCRPRLPRRRGLRCVSRAQPSCLRAGFCLAFSWEVLGCLLVPELWLRREGPPLGTGCGWVWAAGCLWHGAACFLGVRMSGLGVC